MSCVPREFTNVIWAIPAAIIGFYTSTIWSLICWMFECIKINIQMDHK
jgi:hypothetical protein